MDAQQLIDAQAGAVPQEFSTLAELQAKREEELFDKDNVVGVGLGHKFTDDEDTETNALQVFVRQKLPEELLTKADVIPKTMDRLPTDVIEIGEVFAIGARGGTAPDTAAHDPLGATAQDVDALALRNRVRPVRPGFSVGHPEVTAGTIGAGCYPLTPFPGIPTAYYILSNNHVLANSNAANLGDPILQPGRVDGGTVPRDVVGRLSGFIRINFDGQTCNLVDAAIAQVPFHLLDRDIYWIGIPRSLAVAAQVNMLVRKTGRTTCFTTGRVTSINWDGLVNFGRAGVARFCRQILTTRIGAGGDSGSLVLDLEGNPVGLLFAGSAAATILNPIAWVQALLRVRLWP